MSSSRHWLHSRHHQHYYWSFHVIINFNDELSCFITVHRCAIVSPWCSNTHKQQQQRNYLLLWSAIKITLISHHSSAKNVISWCLYRDVESGSKVRLPNMMLVMLLLHWQWQTFLHVDAPTQRPTIGTKPRINGRKYELFSRDKIRRQRESRLSNHTTAFEFSNEQ